MATFGEQGLTTKDDIDELVQRIENRLESFSKKHQVFVKEIYEKIMDFQVLWETYLQCQNPIIIGNKDDISLYNIKTQEGTEVEAIVSYEPSHENFFTNPKLETNPNFGVLGDLEVLAWKNAAADMKRLMYHKFKGRRYNTEVWNSFALVTRKLCEYTLAHDQVIAGLDEAQEVLEYRTKVAAEERLKYITENIKGEQ